MNTLTDETDQDHAFCHHLIGFFDVLGQSNRLRQLTKIPETDAERAEVLALLQQTAGFVMAARGMFKDFFEAAATPTAWVDSLPHGVRRQVLDSTQGKVHCRGISDSVIVTVSLAATGIAATPVSGVYRSFVAAAGMWLLSLSLDHPLRGALEVGLGIDIGGGEVYGPVVDIAYQLESKVAGGPRIVVGRTCLEYLNYVRNVTTDDMHQRVAAGVSDICLSMLRTDTDGIIVLDPLGDRMLEINRVMTRHEKVGITDRVKPAHDIVRQQLMRAELGNDEKLIPRYRDLLTYFDQRAGRWA